MHRAIPLISEHVDELKQHLRHEHDGHQKPRLQMLYILASGPVRTRFRAQLTVARPSHTKKP